MSAQKWFEFLKSGNLNFGTRIHGNIAGILSGVPAYIVAPDSRVLELARYHNIPHTTIKDLDVSKDIFQLLNGVDFSSVKNGHKERFNNYLDFLHANGILTIFDEKIDISYCEFDRRIDSLNPRSEIIPNIHLNYERQLEAVRLWEWLIKVEREKIERLLEENLEIKQNLDRLKRRSLYYNFRRLGGRALSLIRDIHILP